MINYVPTRQDLELLQQKARLNYVRLTVLECKEFTENDTVTASHLLPIGDLEGFIQDGSFNLDVDSDIRRSCNLTAVIYRGHEVLDDPSFIWVNKFAKLEVGGYHLQSQTVLWYPLGIFLFNGANYNYNATTHTLQLSLVDLMSELNGALGGNLTDFATEIPAGSSIRNALTATVTQLGFIDRYIIDENYQTVPYDLKYGPSNTVYNIITDLRDLYVGWETFFDVHGRFIFQRIPDDDSDEPILDSETLSPLIIDEQVNLQIDKIKNHSVVWGQLLEADYFTDDCVLNQGIYDLTFNLFVALESNTWLGFTATANSPANPSARLTYRNLAGNNVTTAAIPILNEDGTALAANAIKAGNSYVLSYLTPSVSYPNGQFFFYGEYQIKGEYEVNAADHPPGDPLYDFCVETIGRKTQVFSGGEYDKIYSKDLAVQRAKYETHNACRYNDQLTLNMIAIPWLNGNEKIAYYVKSLREVRQYTVKSFSMSFNAGTMTVNLVRAYQDLGQAPY